LQSEYVVLKHWLAFLLVVKTVTVKHSS
jgi:hypothetical protein